MEKKKVSGIMLTLLLLGMLTAVFNVVPVLANSSIHSINMGTVLGLYPRAPPQNPGEILTIMVNVTQVTDLYTWVFRSSWRVGLLTCISVQEETGFFDGEFDSREKVVFNIELL